MPTPEALIVWCFLLYGAFAVLLLVANIWLDIKKTWRRYDDEE